MYELMYIQMVRNTEKEKDIYRAIKKRNPFRSTDSNLLLSPHVSNNDDGVVSQSDLVIK